MKNDVMGVVLLVVAVCSTRYFCTRGQNEAPFKKIASLRVTFYILSLTILLLLSGETAMPFPASGQGVEL